MASQKSCMYSLSYTRDFSMKLLHSEIKIITACFTHMAAMKLWVFHAKKQFSAS
jgi:hypothetical protein